ncbi:hypothetical protein LguiB_001782 [Lonicera macranthoides]
MRWLYERYGCGRWWCAGSLPESFLGDEGGAILGVCGLKVLGDFRDLLVKDLRWSERTTIRCAWPIYQVDVQHEENITQSLLLWKNGILQSPHARNFTIDSRA